MLTKMRKPVAKAITFVLFGLLILSFAVWGIGDIFRGPGQSTAVAEVGSIQIDQMDFDRSLRQEMNRLRASFGGQIDFDTARQLGLVEQTLQQMVNRALFDQQANDLRMVVTEDQVKRVIAGEQAFQNQFGDFDRLRFDNVLRTMGLSEAGYVASVSGDLKRQQIVAAIGGVTEAPEALARELFFYGEERRTAEVIEIARDGFTELPAASDEDLAQLHEEASAQFMRPETRSISLLQLRASDLAGEMAVSEEDIQLAFEDRREEFGAAERREIEQIVLDSEEEAQAAKQRADQGAAFEALAEEAGGGAPISLGEVTRGELELQLPELAEAAFAAAEGAVAAPVETGFGWHLVHVKSITPGREPQLAEVRDRLEEDLSLERAVDALVAEANRLDDAMAGGASLEEAAAALDLAVQKVPAIDARGSDGDGGEIADLPPLEELLPVLRDTQVGQDSLLTETPDGDYFVLRVDGVSPAVLRPLEEVRADVEALWQARQRDSQAETRAEALAARAAEGVELAKIAEDEGLIVARRGPVDRFGQGPLGERVSRALAERLFELDKGAVAAVAGDAAWLVAKLVEVERPDPSAEAETFDAVGEQLSQTMNGDLLSSFSAALRAETAITVNRALLEDLTARY